MALDPVPWFVGGGAQHSPEVARLLAYAATGGAEGVVEPGDLKVTPLSVPGGAVQALPGAALVRNRGAGGDSQTYVARNVTATQVEIAATGSSGGRSDLVVVQVEDPNVAGEPWQTPPDPTVGPYVFVRVIPNVPAGTTRLQDVPGYEGRTAYTLARIDLPPSTGTVTAGMITDLRRVANPRSLSRTFMAPTGTHFALTSTAWVDWPGVTAQLDIPDWATHMSVVATIAASGYLEGSVRGNLQIAAGSAYEWVSMAAEYDLDVPANDAQRVTLVLGGDDVIPAALRGVSGVPLRIRGQRLAFTGNGRLMTAAGMHVIYQVMFEERAA